MQLPGHIQELLPASHGTRHGCDNGRQMRELQCSQEGAQQRGDQNDDLEEPPPAGIPRDPLLEELHLGDQAPTDVILWLGWGMIAVFALLQAPGRLAFVLPVQKVGTREPEPSCAVQEWDIIGRLPDGRPGRAECAKEAAALALLDLSVVVIIVFEGCVQVVGRDGHGVEARLLQASAEPHLALDLQQSPQQHSLRPPLVLQADVRGRATRGG
mmetsp:Transcript_90576/g.251856  ORF Transcript_90576/g.251856 Transcript_90576/m.251856 type:complete len:213 (-) Transcript_90576:1750-2388(-)